MLKVVDAFDGIAVDVASIQQIADAAYTAVVEWFGAPQDANWPCDITQGRFSACAWSFLMRRYTIFIDREQMHTCQIVSVLGHEMYHRVAGRRKTLRRQVWIDELLAFSVQQRFLREQGFEANAEEVDQRILQSTVAVDFNRLHQARAKRIRLGLGGIRYPQDFGFMIGRLSLALDLLLEWQDLCLLASMPDLPAWYAQLDPSVSPVVIALLTSQDTEGATEQMRLEALTAQLSFTDGLDAWLGLSQAYQVIGHMKASYFLLCQILAAYPEQPKALGALANLLFARGQLPEAINYYEQALIFTPEDAWIRKNYGSALYQTGKKEQAHRQWQYIVENGDEDEREASAALLAKFG